MNSPGLDPRPRGALSRRRLLQAALHTFAEKGFEGASLRLIAERAQLNSALISFHFGGKEGLYQAALQLAASVTRRRAAQLPPVSAAGTAQAGSSAVAGLRALAEVFQRTAPPGTPEEAAAALVAKAMTDPRPGTLEILAAALAPLRAYLDRCLQALRPDLEEAARARMALSLECQFLLALTLPGLLAALDRASAPGPGPESLGGRALAYSLQGLAGAPRP